MFGIRALLESASALDVPVTDESLARRRVHLARELKKRNGYAVALRGVARVRLPSARHVTERLVAAAQPPDRSPPEAFAAAEALLLKPSQVFALPDAPDPPAGYRVRRVTLATALSINDETWVGFGELHALESTKARWVDDASITCEWLSDPAEIADRLERLYMSAPSLAGLPKATPAWWVGGGGNFAAPERRRIAAVGHVAGLDIEFADTLKADALFGALGQGGPDHLAVWRPRLDPLGQKVVDRFLASHAARDVFELDAADFDETLRQLRQQAHVAATRLGTEEDVAGPDCVLDAVHRAESDCKHIVILKDARDSARSSYYQRPAHVLSLLRALDEVVGMWKKNALPEGGFEAAFASLGIAGYRADISLTAKQKYGDDYVRTYGEKPVMLGPHLANGTGAVTRILRIYWYVDHERRTFVVGHVGRKLRDSSNP